MARICIVCQKEASGGHPVEDDAVIHGIRKIKQALGVAKNNELVVGEDCMEEHKKKREKYEKNLVMHIVIAAIVLILFVALPIFSGAGFSLSAVVLGIVLAALIISLSVFNHWPKTASVGAAKKAEAKKKKK